MVDIKALKTSLYNLISAILTTSDSKADQENSENDQNDDDDDQAERYPYAVYKLTSSFNGEKDNNQNIHFMLELDVWDKNSDSSDIDDLCSTIDNALIGTSIITAAFYYTLQRVSPYIPIPDPGENIQHRQIRFLVKVQFL